MTVALSATPSGAVTFGAGTVTFDDDNPWNRYQQVQVNAEEDDVDDPGDSRSASIEFNPAGGGRYDEVTSVRMSVTIEDDDTKGLTLSPKKVSVTEGDDSTSPNTTTDYTVRLNSKPSKNVRVDITSLDPKIAKVAAVGQAVATLISLTFTRDTWNQLQTVTVHSVPDEVDNDGRSVRIKHVAHGGGYDGVTDENEVTIDDDDETDLILIVVGTISEDGDANDATKATIDVRLNSKPTGNVRVIAKSADQKVAKVAVKKSDGIPGTPATSASLTFTPDNWDSPQTVTVSGVDDDVEDSNGRMVDISFTANGGGYRNVMAKESVTVTDNDLGTSGITLDVISVITEGEEQNYNVSLNPPPLGRVTVTIKSTNTKVAKVKVGSGTFGTSATLTFTPDNSATSQPVTVFGVDNDIAANLMATITHIASPSSGLAVDTSGKRNMEVTVNNDADTADLTSSKDEVSVKEGGRDTYTIKLRSEPTDDVTVEVVSANPDIATATLSTLKFTSVNWKNPRTVTVVGTNNEVDEGSTKSTSIEHTVSSDGEDYGSAQNKSIDVVVIDDDNAGLTVIPTALTISEGRTDTFMVKLNTNPSVVFGCVLILTIPTLLR